MDCSTPGLPVHHQLPEPTQIHVHGVDDAIQSSHPLSSPSPPAFNLSQHQGLFQWVSSLHEVAKVLEFQLQHQSFQWTSRADLLQDGLVGSPCSPRDSQESSPTPQFKSINSSVLRFLFSFFLVLPLYCYQPISLHPCAHMLSHVIPWTSAHQTLSMDFSRQEYWSGVPFPTPGDLSNPGIEPTSLGSPVLTGRFFTTK